MLERELANGRAAFDARHQNNALVDIEGDYLIEVKAFGGSARGSDLWPESRQVQAALDDPARFHLVVVVSPSRWAEPLPSAICIGCRGGLLHGFGDSLGATLDHRQAMST